jgi:hypothetical protein
MCEQTLACPNHSLQGWIWLAIRGGPLEKWWGVGKQKNRAGETERKTFVHQESLEKKFVQRLFNRENYKLK